MTSCGGPFVIPGTRSTVSERYSWCPAAEPSFFFFLANSDFIVLFFLFLSKKEREKKK